MTTSLEKELVKRAAMGDVPAFEDLVSIYQKKVYNIALNFFKNHDDALEISQEAFIKVFRSIGSFNGKSSFSTWLFRIVTNTCIDEFRKRNNITVVYIDEEVESEGDKPYKTELRSNFEEPQEAYSRKEMRLIIMEALNKIPVELKTMIILRDINGFNYEEISHILNLPLGTVKSRISRARESLKNILKSYSNLELSPRNNV